MNSFSAATYTHETSERKAVTMDCLYLEVVEQSCLLDSVDQGVIKNGQIDLLDRMTKKRVRFFFLSFFPHIDVTRNL